LWVPSCSSGGGRWVSWGFQGLCCGLVQQGQDKPLKDARDEANDKRALPTYASRDSAELSPNTSFGTKPEESSSSSTPTNTTPMRR
jgi:hypothetical protein